MDSQQQNDSPPEDRETAQSANEQERRPASEGHAGQGADSAMKQMRVWEQRRASQSGGKGHQGPH